MALSNELDVLEERDRRFYELGRWNRASDSGFGLRVRSDMDLVSVYFVNAFTGVELGMIETILPYQVDQHEIREEVGLDLTLYTCTMNWNLHHLVGTWLSERDRGMRSRILEDVGGGVLPWRVCVDRDWARGHGLRIPLLRRPTIACPACSRTIFPARFAVAPWLGRWRCLHCILDEDRINTNVGICDACERHGRVWPLIDASPICAACTADLRDWESSDDALDASETEVFRIDCWDCGAQGVDVRTEDTWVLCSDCFVSWPRPF